MVERWRRDPAGSTTAQTSGGGWSTAAVAVHSPVARVVGTLDELLAGPIDDWAS